jgi:hypothetical protein
MAQIARANPYLGELIEMLAAHLDKWGGDPGIALDHLSASENALIDEELLHCMMDARYFISNYYAYRDEKEGFKGLYPLFDSQEILHDEYRRLEKVYGCIRAMVDKSRQMGSTTYNCAELFHKTIFKEHTNSIIVAQDDDQTVFIMGMYESALDYLPWWMRPRIYIKQAGKVINFDERDEATRAVRPGLKSWVYAMNANKPSGVGRGKTFGRGLLSELAFWENKTQLSKSLIPTFNTQDGFYVMESTPNGRNDTWHNLWRKAEAGKIDWNPIYIPFYRRDKTYSIPIKVGETFIPTPEELLIREQVFKKDKYFVKDEVLNWRRNKIEFFMATDGDDAMFSQEYSMTAEESFQSSAVTAFPRGIIRKFSKRTAEPKWIGEINYDWTKGVPVLHMQPLEDGQEAMYPEIGNRLHMWKKREQGAEYCIGGDVALGNPGGDYSCLQVIKKGQGIQRDEQVAVWHGLINPTALAEIALALGWYYNEALAAIEVNSYGMQTNSVLMRNYEYDNIYRFKRLDRLGMGMTNIVGFYSDVKSTDALMAKMSEYFLEDLVDIPCKFTMDEFNDYTEQGADGDGAHDDYVDAIMIAIYCAHEAEVRERQDGNKKPAAETEANKFYVKDRFGTIMAETNSQNEAQRISKKHVGTSIERVAGATAMVTLAGRKRKVPADFANTDFSPIHDKTGTAHRLHYEEDVPAEDITPELVQAYDDMMEDETNNQDPDAWKYA